MKPNQLRIDDGGRVYVRVHSRDSLSVALEAAGLPSPGPVLVIVGGAGGLDAATRRRLTPLFSDGLAPAIDSMGAVAVDGGTDAGVMRLLGDAREASASTFPLLGVAAEGTVHFPGSASSRSDAADLEPHHTHFLLVPGDQWGDEAPWISATASELAGGASSLTVLVNGGDIAYRDAILSVEAKRPLLVICGSGRAADEIGAAILGEPADPRAQRVGASGLASCVDVDDPVGVGAAVRSALRAPMN